MSYESRKRVVDYFRNAPSPLVRHSDDYNIWCVYDSASDYMNSVLRDRYGVDLETRVCDNTVRLNETLTVRNRSGGVARCVVRKSGAPLALMYVRRIAEATAARGDTADADSVPVWASVHIFPHVYVLESSADRAWACYVRALENGVFVKISVGDVLKEKHGVDMRKCLKQFGRAMSASACPAMRFENKCYRTLKELFEALNAASDESSEMESLVRLLQMAYQYNECFPVKPGESVRTRKSWEVDKNGHYVRRVASFNMREKRLEPVLTPNTSLTPRVCVVANCSLVPKPSQVSTGTQPTVSLSVCLRHSTIDKDDHLPDVTYNFCREHGHLFVSAWYLIHVRRTWTADYNEELKFGCRREVRVFNTTAESVYQFLDRTKVQVEEYRARFNAAFACVRQFTRHVNAYLEYKQAASIAARRHRAR